MRLIDADAFLKRNEVYADCEFIHPMYQNTLREIVDDEPTIDAVQVRHAKWKITGANRVDCSACGHSICFACVLSKWSLQGYSYCPNCGARMDGERREG